MPPKKGDLIYVEFEAGDPNKPVWTGFWWAENEMPEDANSNTIVLVSRNGNKVVLDDENDEIKFVHSTGSELSMTSNEIVFRIEKTKMVISKQGISINDGALEVKTTG